MRIKVGDRMPVAMFKQLSTNGIANIDSASLLKGKKVVLFGLLGAYMPVCSASHLPGFVSNPLNLRLRE